MRTTAILTALLLQITSSYCQVNYCGPYTTSAPIKLSGVSNKVISGLKITNPGGHCIELSNCTNITIEKCMLGPSSGEGVNVENCTNITITNTRFEQIESALYALTSTGINFSYNEIKNIMGPPDPRGQMCQFDKVTGGGNRINYNRCENIPGQSNPEDLVNIYHSSGTAADPIQVYGNWLRGGGPSASGGGILIGDGGSAYVTVKDNILVDPGQYGMAISGGNNIQLLNNRIYGKQQSFTNCGLYIWAQAGAACSNNTVSGNRINYFNSEGKQNSLWDAGNCPGTVLSNNVTADPTVTASILPTQILTPITVPGAAGTITGSTTVNQGQTGVIYSVAAITNATSYVWTLPAGATGSSSTNSITVSFSSTAQSGTIKLKGRSGCGDGSESSLYVTLKSTSTPTNAPTAPSNLKAANIISTGFTLSWTESTSSSSSGTKIIPEGSVITAEQASTRYIVFNPAADWNDDSKIVWYWKPAETAGIDATLFALPTDAKRVLGGTHVIVSATGGGVAMIRISDKKVMFFAEPAGNPHSLELLPDSNIVVASSEGNKLTLYATKGYPGSVTSKTYTLTGAHGVVWDNGRKVLWAMGASAIKCYSYNNNRTNPALTEINNYNLPHTTGHDLAPMYETDKLFFTTDANVGLFNLTTKTFETYSTLNGTTGIKSISQKEANGQVLYMKSTTDWWSDGIRFVNGTTKTRTGAEFYKARWWVPNPFSYPSDNLISYDIYNGTQKIATVNGSSYNVTGLSPNTTYSFTIKARDLAGNESAASSALQVKTLLNDTQAPSAPSGTKASNIATTSFTLSWTASTDNTAVSGYDIYQNNVFIKTVTMTTVAITGLTQNTSYSYFIKARDAAGNISASSSALTVTTLKAPDTQAPVSPKNLTATQVTANSLTLTWTAATDNVGVAGYVVYKNNYVVATVATMAISITGLDANATYLFTVKAKDGAGNLSPSAAISVSTKAADIITAENGINIYPNPVTNSQFFIELPEAEEGQAMITLTDLNGMVVMQKSLEIFKVATITTPANLNGIYLLEVRSDDYVFIKKIFIFD